MIKFRAWDKQRDRLSVIDRLYFNTKGAQLRDDFGLYWRDMNDIILMQSTGLFDKNGVEIFVGDVVKAPNHTDVVRYYSGMFEPVCYYESDSLEVLGNMYENPNLVGVRE